MGIRLKIEGVETIQLDEHNILTSRFMFDTSSDTAARATDVLTALEVTGKILTAVDGTPVDDTQKIARWSLVRAESADCYRVVTVEVISAGQVVRKYQLPNAFVSDYDESFGEDGDGSGKFRLIARQKSDLFDKTKVEGGYDL